MFVIFYVEAIREPENILKEFRFVCVRCAGRLLFSVSRPFRTRAYPKRRQVPPRVSLVRHCQLGEQLQLHCAFLGLSPWLWFYCGTPCEGPVKVTITSGRRAAVSETLNLSEAVGRLGLFWRLHPYAGSPLRVRP